jgi:hypothetical protein
VIKDIDCKIYGVFTADNQVLAGKFPVMMMIIVIVSKPEMYTTV